MKFHRWLGVEQNTYDHAYVRVSNNGSAWTTVWENPGSHTEDGSWQEFTYDISSVADGESTVYLRWTMGGTDTSWQYCGWNLDDIQIIAIGGPSETCDDGIQNQGEDRIDCGGPCPPCECISDAACSDGAFCTGSEQCDAYGQCQDGTYPCPGQMCRESDDTCVDCLADGDCDDTQYCNGVETCDGNGDCQAGADVDCADGVTCTDDSCNEGTDSCDNIPYDGLCDDGGYCNGAETCDALLDCQAGTEVDCNDGVTCTDDSCDEGTDSCDNIPNDGLCDDGAYCNGVETCDAELGCQAGDDPCDPGEWCDEDSDACIAYGDGDFDGDGDVDLDDFLSFQTCFESTALGGCEAGNFTGDGVIDLDDFTEFVAVMTGP